MFPTPQIGVTENVLAKLVVNYRSFCLHSPNAGITGVLPRPALALVLAPSLLPIHSFQFCFICNSSNESRAPGMPASGLPLTYIAVGFVR